jgi:sulfhydrogenase subunit beta (sulfur reductase)
MYALTRDKLPEFLEYLSKKAELIIPHKKGGVSYFKNYEAGDKPYIDRGNTDYSAKQFFFPYKEVMFGYDKFGNIEQMPKHRERILFGVRPCDLHAIAVMDMFFSDDPPDPYYLERRKSTTIIAVDCTTPGKNCFCDSLGKRDAIGHDILLIPDSKFYYASGASERGKKLIEESGLFKKTDSVLNIKKIPCKKSANPVDASRVKWGKWGAQCFACAACTSICPTCTCFDVEDETQLDRKTERQRIWASCFTKDFTTVAGNHCFRPERTDMLKQFVSHKFPYFKDKFGVTMCVGCGRCITVCTAKIDISKMISGK